MLDPSCRRRQLITVARSVFGGTKRNAHTFSPENKGTNFGGRTFIVIMEELCFEVVESGNGGLADNVGGRGNSGDIVIFSSLATFAIRLAMTVCCDAIKFCNVSNTSARVSNLERTASCRLFITENWSSRALERVTINCLSIDSIRYLSFTPITTMPYR